MSQSRLMFSFRSMQRCLACNMTVLTTAKRSITSSHTLVPPQSSTSDSDMASIPGLKDVAATSTTSQHDGHTMPFEHQGSPSASTSSSLPYYITRTDRNRSLPVYSDIRNGGTRQEVQIRHLQGDLNVSCRHVERRDVPFMKAFKPLFVLIRCMMPVLYFTFLH